MALTTPSALALQNLKTHLETKLSDWSVSRVDDYPSYYQPAMGGPIICLEVESFQLVWAQVAGKTREFDWKTTIRITYYDLNLVPENAYRETVEKLGLVTTFLVTSNQPNNYGNLLIDGAGFGPELVLLPNAPDRNLYGGQLRVIHTITATVTAS